MFYEGWFKCTNTSVNNSDNVKKLQYKNTKRKNTIYYENGEKIQQFKFKADDEEIKDEEIKTVDA